MNTKWLFFYVSFSFAFDLMGLVIEKANFPLFWIRFLIYGFYMLQFLLLSIYFYKQKIITQREKLIFPILITIGLLSYFFFLFFERLPVFNIYGSAIIALIIIVYCILGFKKITSKSTNLYIERSAFFWVLSGFILYFSGSFFVFTFGRYIQSQNREYFIFLWIFVHDFLNIIKNICLAVSFTRKTE